MNAAVAASYARQIQAILTPYCEIAPDGEPYCAVAGSIRRGLLEVNDIDLVVIPRDQLALRARALRASTPIQDGPHNLLIRIQNGVQIDIFFARLVARDLLETRPSTWGSVLLCRTGSREHNIKLCDRAEGLGYKWKTTEGLFDLETGLWIAGETEEQIFAALKMPFIPPHQRS